MNQRLVVLFLFLMMGNAGCGGTNAPQPATEQPPPSSKEQAKAPAPADVDSYGHLGKSSIGGGEQTYQCALPYWQKGKRVLFLGVVEYPRRALGPAYFVVVRLPPDYSGSSFSANVSTNHVDKPTAWIWMRHSTADGPTIEYQVLKHSHKEQFKIGDKDYGLEAGRVFLVDQATKPPAVQQAMHDLADLFRAVGSDPSREAFSAAVEKLHAGDDQARRLLNKIEGK